VGPADVDVVELSLVAQGDEPGSVDAVGADAVVGVGGPVAEDGLRAGGVSVGRSRAAGQRAVRAAGVVDGGEGVEQCLELGEGGGLAGLGAEPCRTASAPVVATPTTAMPCRSSTDLATSRRTHCHRR
jgi:hypothetical protein